MMGKVPYFQLLLKRMIKMVQTDLLEIIRRYFQGKLSESEYIYLTDVLRTPENKKLFDDEKLNWNNSPIKDELVLGNWNRLHYKINRNPYKIANFYLRSSWAKIASIAAILAVGLLLGGIFSDYTSKKQTNKEVLVFETPRGEKSKVILPDGSKIWLNANSKLIYHSFGKVERKVELIGEAYFEVAHINKIPFIVKVNNCDVTVLGTKFNVMAYKEFGRNEITLLEGSVRVKTTEKQYLLVPGQMLVFKTNQVIINKVNPFLSIGWVESKFSFKNIPLNELIKKLENWYDIDIILENKTGKEVNFTGTFKNEETIWQVLDAIKVYLPIKFEKTNLRKIKITVM